MNAVSTDTTTDVLRAWCVRLINGERPHKALLAAADEVITSDERAKARFRRLAMVNLSVAVCASIIPGEPMKLIEAWFDMKRRSREEIEQLFAKAETT